MSSNRRTFLKTSAGAAALSAATYAGAADAPNNRVRVAVMGVRGRGNALVSNFVAQPDVDVVAICDIDDAAFGKAVTNVEKVSGKTPRKEKDVRKIIEDKSIDVLVIAAPDHWHAPATVWACEAGKDVYVEKPVSHNLLEGRLMVDTARKHKRIVQCGTQRRSGEQFKQAAAFLQGGGIGKIHLAKSWIIHRRVNIGKKGNAPVPAGVDYNLWLGPAAETPFNPNHFHYNWHWFWEYGTGELGNNGIHGLDVARWGLGLEHPSRISSSGGKYYFADDDQETPDTQLVSFDYPDCTLTWEHRTWYQTGKPAPAPAAGAGGAAKATPASSRGFGVSWHGTKGTLLWDGDWRILDGDAVFEAGKNSNIETGHARNFLDCIKSRNLPNADILQGHLSTSLCHLGNISHRLRKTLAFDPATESFADKDANALLGRAYRKGFELPIRTV